ncbi:NACHT domain-containing protein [Actinoplanes oblitus]|uniref:NACHT domain-containing protein n=1 Tax=Actinoplanes oblitus TaxID=3040509 RepID=A0ABY8WU99_9ACTN|nr:NACHT domain-containing protein [Actinoplanes oblitus]WIN00622.1 NACHT domain-containing protein [Actinoplanes oblitus]
MPRWSRQPRFWFGVSLVVLLLLVCALAWFLQHQGLDRADKWASVVFGGAGTAAVVVGALSWLWRLGGPRAVPVGDDTTVALDWLAGAQREQWQAEQAARRVRDPWPLNVRWLSSARAQAVMASWASVRGRPGAAPAELAGEYAGIADLFTVPGGPRRLVVLGEPGAGKSMLVVHLALQLLARRTAHEPVPVVLSAAGWNPVLGLDDWVAEQIVMIDRRLARQVPGPGGAPRSLARDLVARGLILPVLDGLDEMADSLQQAAIRGIAQSAGTGHGLVVTCRTRPYEAAVAGSGPVPAAAVVEIQPVAARAAARHLADSAALTDRRWQPVVVHLTEVPDAPLARALSTPLMIWLARTVYQDPVRDPGELLTAGWATTRGGIEQHLLEHLVGAAYASALGRYPARTAEDAARVRRWLGTVAAHLREQRTYELAWWHFNELRPVPDAQFVSVAFSVIVALFTACAAMPAGMAAFDHGRVSPWLMSWYSGATIGLVTAYARLLFTDRSVPRQLTLAGAVTMYLVVGAPLGVVATLAGQPVVGLGLMLSAGTVSALVAGSSVAAAATRPSRSLHVDRRTALVAGLTAGLATGFLCAVALGDSSPGIWAAIAVIAAAAVVSFSAWGQFCLARLVSAVAGGMPLRMMGALEEAHARGVLRRAGGVYQFRHNLLQDHLATHR